MASTSQIDAATLDSNGQAPSEPPAAVVGTDANGQHERIPVNDADGSADDQQVAQEEESQAFEISLYLPDRPLLPTGPATAGLPEVPNPLTIAVTPQETLNDLRVTITESPEGYWLGAFCFRRPASDEEEKRSVEPAKGKASSRVKLGDRVSEWIELREIFDGVPKGKRELYVTHVPFNEAEARAHVQRMKGLLSGGQADPTSMGIDSGVSVQDAVRNPGLWRQEAVGAGAQPTSTKQGSKKAKAMEEEAAAAEESKLDAPFLEWDGWKDGTISQLVPPQARPPRQFPQCLRLLALSTYNPPPQYLRVRGHLLYLHIGTLEGENLFITASAQGFYINRSTTARFDSAPRPGKEALQSSSLFDLLCAASPLFLSNFVKLFQDPIAVRDYFAILPLGNCLPAQPWLVRQHAHHADALRNQTAYLLTGATSTETLDGTRDWNDEIQSTREMPRSTLSERLLRDRILNRTYAEFTMAAARAVPRVAAGEVLAMNPMDKPDAQMFTVSNIFISKGADGVDIYPHLGGDEAAHVAVSKDLLANRTLNNFDVDGLCLLGTVVVDWKGERWVAQSVVPGLFRRRDDDDEKEEGEGEGEGEGAEKREKESEEGKAVASEANGQEGPAASAVAAGKEKKANDPKEDTQVVYGGVEGPEVIRTDASFHNIFGKIARALHLAEHDVADAEGKSHRLWLSVDSKGLRGADGRKYALDLARLCPVDIEWLERDVDGEIIDGDSARAEPRRGDDEESSRYPHRMTLLRQELLQVFYDAEFRKWAQEQIAAKQAAEEGDRPKQGGKESGEKENGKAEGSQAREKDRPADGEGKSSDEAGKAKDESKDADEEEAATKDAAVIDASQFKLSFNPDAFVAFKSQDSPAEAEPDVPVKDESDPAVAAVRSAARYLRDTAIPRLVTDVAAGIHTAMDGASLTRQLHARGINVRYLGHIARLCHPSQKDKLDQNMLSRAGPGHEGFLKAFSSLVVQEMALRAAKRILRALLKTTEHTDMAACTSHFLNCLLGFGLEPAPAPVVHASPFEGPDQGTQGSDWRTLTPESLADQLQVEVRRRFRFELPKLWLQTEMRKQPMLRELSLRCGVQLKLQDYIFEASPADAAAKVTPNGTDGQHASGSGAEDATGEAQTNGSKKKKGKGGGGGGGGSAQKKASGHDLKNAAATKAHVRTTTFEPEDVLCFVPVVKDSTPKSSLAEEAFEAGRISMSRGDRNLGVELLMESIGFHEQVYNIVHPEVARCYALFATIVHHFASLAAVEQEQRTKQALAEGKEAPPPVETSELLTLANALRYQRQAVTVSERTLGLDHPETLTNWMNLATLERSEGNTEAALRCQRRVLELHELIYGKEHPDAVGALSHVALTLQNARLFEPSLKLYAAAHELALKLFGPESIHTANMAHELSQAHTLCGDLKSALVVEKEAWRVFEARLGKDDGQTRESEHFLNSLTASAVRVARMEKEEKARQAQRGRLGLAPPQPQRAPSLLRPNGTSGGGAASAAAAAANARGRAAAAATTGAGGGGGGGGASTATTPVRSDPALATSSIDDLVAFIQGGGSSAQQASRKAKAKTVKRAGKRA